MAGWFRWALVLALTGLVLAACGGGDSADSQSTAKLTSEEKAYDKENRELVDTIPLPEGAERAREIARRAPYFQGRLLGVFYGIEGSSPEAVLEFFRQSLPDLGWQLIASEDDSDRYDKGDARLVVNVAPVEDAGEFLLAVDSRCGKVAEACANP